jgi:hypothetical protein
MAPGRASVADQERTTLVLDDHFSHERFATYMKDQGWTIRNRTDTGSGSDRAIEEVWGKNGVPVAVHYLDDGRLWTRALWIRGRNIRPVLSDLSPKFGGPTPTELVERVAEAETTKDRVEGLVRLAVGFADAFDANVLDIFTQFADDENKKVRGAVVQALLYTEWPEALPLLEKMAAEDESPEIRGYAGNVVAHLSRPRDER